VRSTRPRAASRVPIVRERLSTEERREQLLASAKTLFLDRPYDQVSMDDVASSAGVSKALVFHYFSTKRDLYVELVRRAAAQMLEATFVGDAAPPGERLALGLSRYMDFVQEQSKGYVALLSSGVGLDSEVFGIVDSVRRTLATRILSNLPIAAPHAELAVRGYIGFVEAASLAWLDEKKKTRMPKEQLISLMVSVLVSALGLSPP